MQPSTDRELQDVVIRALADAPFRSSGQWQQLALADFGKVDRFARFLARHFYFERIVHFFKYSGALSAVTGRRPQEILLGDGFNALLPELVLGSRPAAVGVASLVVDHIAGHGGEHVPYLADLLVYEKAMMVAEAGPRVWRNDRATAASRQDVAYVVTEGTQVLELQFDITAVLGALLQKWSTVPRAPNQPIRLIVTRSDHGRVVVAHSTPDAELLLGLSDGLSSVEKIASQANLQQEQLGPVLGALVEWGALKPSLGS